MQQNFSDDTLVNLQEEYDKTEIQEVIDELEKELIGLVPVKTRIREIAALLLIDRLRNSLNLVSGSPGLHMSFTGSPGTGKTTVAMKMADILHRLGYIRKGHLLTADLRGNTDAEIYPYPCAGLRNFRNCSECKLGALQE